MDAEREDNEGDIRNFSLFIQSALGNREAAQELVALRLKVRPWESQEYYREVFTYYRRVQDINLIVEAAGKAGVPP